MSDKKPSRKNWKLRLAVCFLAAFAAYLCFGVFVVPMILKSQIQEKGSEALGRAVTLEKATFNPLTLEAKLYGLGVGPSEGADESLLRLEKLSANLQVSSLFGPLALKWVTLEDADFWVTISESGGMSFDDVLTRVSAEGGTETEAQEESEIFLVKIMDTEFLNVRIHFLDNSLATPFEETLTIESFEGRDLGTVAQEDFDESVPPEERYHWDFVTRMSTASGAQLLFDGGASRIDPWEFSFHLALNDLGLSKGQPYVDEIVAASIGGLFDAEYTVKAQLGSEARFSIEGEASVSDFSVKDENRDWLAFESLSFSGISAEYPELKLLVNEVKLESPQIEATLNENGSLILPEIKTASVADASGDASDDETALPAFLFELRSFQLAGGRIDFHDNSLSQANTATFESIRVEIEQLFARSTEEGDIDAGAIVAMGLDLFGGQLNIDGEVAEMGNQVSLNVSAQGIQFAPLQPYINEQANAIAKDGAFFADIRASASNLESFSVDGDFRLENLMLEEVENERQVFSVSEILVDGFHFDNERVEAEEVRISEPLITIWQSEAGTNLEGLIKIEQQAEAVVAKADEQTELDYEIRNVQVLSAGVEFVDTTPLSTHTSKISDFNFAISPLSSEDGVLSDFSFEGQIDRSAKITGKGKLDTLNPDRYLDLEVVFDGYDLTATSPYWETYLGRGLSKGHFEIRSNYEVRDSQLKGTNDFMIDQITLGEKVESERAINLPVGFAINLMKDPKGVIDYKGLPVEGDLSDPSIKPWGLVAHALRNLVLKAATAPFKFLAAMVGGSEDLNVIDFAVGEVALDEAASEKLDSLIRILSQRPGISIEVSYSPDPEEKEYLITQYAKMRLLNPNFVPMSGLDLLGSIDEGALRAKVESEYDLLMDSDSAEETASDVIREPAETRVEPVSDDKPEKRKGVVGKLLGVFGVGKSKEPLEPMEELALESETATSQVSELEVPEVDYETKLERVLESREPIQFQDRWSEDLSHERIQNFKAALINEGNIDSSRIFTKEIRELKENQASGVLVVEIVGS